MMQSQQHIQAVEGETPPIAPIDIVFKDLVLIAHQKNIWGSQKEEPKVILHGVSGILKHGEMTAIMGSSGSGKTSLLNVLACRIQDGRDKQVTGTCLANGQEYDFSTFSDFGNYVMQSEILSEFMTAREALQFAANLTTQFKKKQRRDRVASIAKDLHIEKCLDTVIGGHLVKGISGGEKKRVSIAIELIASPQVILLDEPTSGLDSMTAFVIARHMKKLVVDENRTVAMTIHQPSAETFSHFDKLILVAEGRITYQGPTQTAKAYFDNLGFTCSTYINPPDHYVSLMHMDNPKNKQNYKGYLTTYYSQLAPVVNQQIQQSERRNWFPREHSVPFCTVLKMLLWREVINNKRNPLLLVTRLLQMILIGPIIGGVFWNLGQDYSPAGLQNSFINKSGALIVAAMCSYFSCMIPVVATYPQERPVLLKQRSSKMYSIFSYLLAKDIIEFPLTLMLAIGFNSIIYWMYGLRKSFSAFIIFVTISYLSGMAGSGFGMFMGTLISNLGVAALFINLSLPLYLLWSGFLKNYGDIPGWSGWPQYINPIKYVFSLYNYNEYRGSDAPVHLLSMDVSEVVCYIILIILIFVFRVMAFVVLYFKSKKRLE